MLRAWGMKDVGRCRDINQDYIFLSEEPMGNLPNLFLVADGMAVTGQAIWPPSIRFRGSAKRSQKVCRRFRFRF